MARPSKWGLLSRESGAAAVEAALVLPPFLMLSIGILSACIAVFAASSLHRAVEAAARCYSVDSSKCGTASATQSYAQSLYKGPSSPTFTASPTGACSQSNGAPNGYQVTATLNYALIAGAASWTIPLSATACYPKPNT
jgi:Flp pilus assembly protein TadG